MSVPFKLKSFGSIFGAETGEDTTPVKQTGSLKSFPSFLDEQDNSDPFSFNASTNQSIEENEPAPSAREKNDIEPMSQVGSPTEQRAPKFQARIRSQQVPNSPLLGQHTEISTPSPARRLAAEEKEITNQITNDVWMEFESARGEPDADMQDPVPPSSNTTHEEEAIQLPPAPSNSPPPTQNHEQQAIKRFRFTVPSRLSRQTTPESSSETAESTPSENNFIPKATVIPQESSEATRALPKPRFGTQHLRFSFKPATPNTAEGPFKYSTPKVIESDRIEEIATEPTDTKLSQIPQSPSRMPSIKDAPQTPTRFTKFNRFSKTESPAADSEQLPQQENKKALILPSRITQKQENHDPRENALKAINWEREIRVIKEMQEYYGRTNSELVNWNQKNAREAAELQDKLVAITIELAQQTSQLVSLRDPVLEYKIHSLNRKLRDLEEESKKIAEE